MPEQAKSITKTIRLPMDEYEDVLLVVHVSPDGLTFNGAVRSLLKHGMGKHEEAEKIRLYERHKGENND